ncbi:MAG: hypothetical protein PHP86_18035 [Nevskiales bacterium]|nr:hypothetical protein [Nevskiales bacterium]
MNVSLRVIGIVATLAAALASLGDPSLLSHAAERAAGDRTGDPAGLPDKISVFSHLRVCPVVSSDVCRLSRIVCCSGRG